ncbi:MAG: cold shock domain-containing protein [Candidatus Brocadiaceae bacterium]|uniref:cold shock domain-containing protein n=1 Tax=Candidatus Wunengus sp. YC61 TaxID=3367698 RepID=UPI0027279028|nr:cold shock domain-containing protein [Candidatus Brocadiaceae bacterium]
MANDNDIDKNREKVGVVKWYDLVKGYGFIRIGETAEELFVHISQVSLPPEMRCLLSGEQVKCVPVRTEQKQYASKVLPLAERSDERTNRLIAFGGQIEAHRATMNKRFLEAIRTGLSGGASQAEINDVLDEFRKAYKPSASVFEFTLGDGTLLRITTSNVQEVIPLIKERLQNRRITFETSLGKVTAEEQGTSGGSNWLWGGTLLLGTVLIGGICYIASRGRE